MQRWASAKDVLKAAFLFEEDPKTKNMRAGTGEAPAPVQEPKTKDYRKAAQAAPKSPSVPRPQKAEPAPVDDRREPTPAERERIQKASAAMKAQMEKERAGPKGRFHAFDHSEEEPSLAEKTRQDLSAGHERHGTFHEGYHKDEQGVRSIRHLRGRSSNRVFHGQMHGGASFISKPHESASEDHEPEHWGRRHEATYALASAMGAHHMVLPGFESKFHDDDQIDQAERHIPHPDEDDLAHEGEVNKDGRLVVPPKRFTMPRFHAGKKTHVVQHEPNHVTVGDATDEQLAGVDHEHRLHGMIMHLLQSNGDGHEDNVMIHGSGHPILIDHDLSFASEHTRGGRQKHGKTVIRSVFSPGGKLDFTANAPKGDDGKPLPIGTEFPERIMKTLKWLALDGHSQKGKHNMGLSKEDAKELATNAQELLKHGLEGVLERRHLHMDNV